MPFSDWSARLTVVGATANELSAISASYQSTAGPVQGALDTLIAAISNTELLVMLTTWRGNPGPFQQGFPGGGLPFGTGVALLTGSTADDAYPISAGTGQKMTTIPVPDLPASVVSDSSGVSAPLVDQAGNKLVNIPAWQTATVYPSGYVVQSGGVAYVATTTFTSGASFGADGANWAPLSSAELGYQQITGNVAAGASGTVADVAGLSVTVTVGARPIKVIVDVQSVQISAAGNFGSVYLFEGATQLAFAQFGVGAVNEIYPVHREVRLAPSAGSHTYKVRYGGNGTIGANDRIVASATSPAFIQVMQV